MEPWSPSLTLPLPPPVVVAFEAKWGVNKSNIHCIVWHPKGPGEVTLEVQITLGHGLLAFSCSISPRRERYPATHRYHHTGLFAFPSPRLIEWAPFWKCTSTGLLSVQAGDHRAERGKVHTVGFLYHHVIQLYRQWGFLSLSYHISALSVWLASYRGFSGPADLAWNLKWEFPQVLCKCCFRPVANSAKLCSCTTTRSEKNAAHGELDAFPAWVIYLEKGQVELRRHR